MYICNMEQKEQTAVEWLIEQLNNHRGNIDILDVANLNGYFEKAKEMELQQLDDIYHDGWADARTAILHS